ncbi:Ig-like domain-containing protein [Anaerolentibacter hominis]|uniref:Ig-like domain-containing protein n=1 Tax=Anaerolentibacter hominis TaxID=3079009 RepID=UPI0031B8279E
MKTKNKQLPVWLGAGILLCVMVCFVLFLGGKEADAATVKLNKTNVNLNVGNTVQLKLSGAKKVTWTSGNKKIATVSKNGKVTAKQTGYTYITAKHNGVLYYCNIGVYKLNANWNGAGINVGQKFELKIDNYDSSKVKWSSSNKKVITVSKKGVITGKKLGSATITGKYDGMTVKSKVTVTDLEISADRFEVLEGQPLQLRVNTQKPVKWSTSDKYCAEVDDNGILTGKREGTVEVCAQVDGKLNIKRTVEILGKPSLGGSISIILKAGSTGTIQVSGTKKEVSWSSSNEAVAVVESKSATEGTIIAKSEGIVTITATVNGESLTKLVVVNAADTPVDIENERHKKVIDNLTRERDNKINVYQQQIQTLQSVGPTYISEETLANALKGIDNFQREVDSLKNSTSVQDKLQLINAQNNLDAAKERYSKLKKQHDAYYQIQEFRAEIEKIRQEYQVKIQDENRLHQQILSGL